MASYLDISGLRSPVGIAHIADQETQLRAGSWGRGTCKHTRQSVEYRFACIGQ